MQDHIASHRYLSLRDISAGRLDSDVLEAYIYEYPGTTFLVLFRMHRASFWQLVTILSDAGGQDYWDQRQWGTLSGFCRPIYQQIAVAIYVLGGGGGTAARTRVTLNIGHGTVWLYSWRTIEHLARLVGGYV